jgi:hypothetical protein
MEQWYSDVGRKPKPTGTNLLSTADIPSEPSKPNHGSVPQLPFQIYIFAWCTKQTFGLSKEMVYSISSNTTGYV